MKDSFKLFSKAMVKRIFDKDPDDMFNSLPNDKILDLSKLKAFADHNLNVN